VNVDDLTGKIVLVTGAASGIGRATALACAERRADLALCDVDETGLAETARRAVGHAGRVLTRRVDVARPQEMEAFAGQVHAELGSVDLLVNNAGVGLGANLAHTRLEDWTWIVGVNLMGVVHGCHFFVPRMVEAHRGGHVVNVASMAGYFPSDGLLAYCTTKSAVIGLSESLRIELAPHGIGVTAICPGVIDTPIVQSTPLRGPGASDAARERMVEAYRRRGYGPERVARNLLRAVARNRAVAPISPEAWAGYYLKRALPRLVLRISGMFSARIQGAG
jgi:NAD(P)-dependent dehydrogenase (short-subunit alcohol dehydrogenase family)